MDIKTPEVDFGKIWTRLLTGAICAVLLALVCLIIFRIGWVTFVDNYELAYTYDRITGEIEHLEHPGYIVTPPLIVNVHTVDLRPMQVCISANKRVLNCKLIKFNPDGLELFLEWHGREDYGRGESGSRFNDILKSYAYEGSGKIYPFLTVLRELRPEDTGYWQDLPEVIQGEEEP